MAHPMYGQNKADAGIDSVAGSYEVIGVAAKTLTAADAGGVFELALAAGVAITLPAARACKAGARFTFICGDASADDTVSRASSADTIAGALGSVASGAAAGITVAAGVVTFDQSGGLAVGDQVQLICDGHSKWYVSGSAAT